MSEANTTTGTDTTTAPTSTVTVAATTLTAEDRLTALESAVKVIAITLYGPNGGGLANVEAAQALYAELLSDPAT